MKSLIFKILYIITILAIIIASISFFLSTWVMNTWVNLTMDELMFQLSVPTEGTNHEMIIDGLLQAGLPVLLITLISIIFLHLVKKHKHVWRISLIVGIIASLVTIGITRATVWETLKVSQYIAYQRNPSTFIEDNYVNPSDADITFPQQKRNLIYIYLESVETTYADISSGGGFTTNVIPELTQIALENEDFSGNQAILNGAYSLPYTTFTMGALFAQSSGLPLKNNLENNDMVTQSNFFSSMTSLGDILEEEGYHNVFLLGSNATFGGRRLYYTQHGSYDIIDYNYAKQTGMIDADYRVWWGYEDSKLLSFACAQLNELSQESQPFNLTILTVDTHFENGYICDLCPDTYDDQYANVMACSSQQIADFLAWCQMQPWYDNTTIILAGDHPTMDSNFTNKMQEGYQRRAYVSYINSAVETESSKYRIYSTLDAFPTTLAAMGVEIAGNRLGLGVNLFSSEPTIIEEYGLGTVTEEINKKSEFMDELANIDYGSEELRERQSKSLRQDHGKTVYDTENDAD